MTEEITENNSNRYNTKNMQDFFIPEKMIFILF